MAAWPAVVLRGLAKRFGAKLAVDGLSLDVPRGSFFGLVGPNGAGKTTTLRALAGILRPTKGADLVRVPRVFRTNSHEVRCADWISAWPCELFLVIGLGLRLQFLDAGQGFFRAFQSLIDTALAAQENRLILDHDLDGNTHGAETVVGFDGAVLLSLGELAVIVGQLGRNGTVWGLATANSSATSSNVTTKRLSPPSSSVTAPWCGASAAVC
jgi:energy-coupling factor transporter ATP-binding protein EcfA2